MSCRHGAKRLYGCFGRHADALFEICDALLASGGGAVSSPVHLSPAPIHRRGWGNLYAALRRGSAEAEALRDLLAQHPLAEEGVEDQPRDYAVDVTVWPRSDAEASPERGYYYHPSRHSAG